MKTALITGAMSVQLDVTDSAPIATAADLVTRAHGALDVLVNNAGILPEATNTDPAEDVDLEMFRRTHPTNPLGPVGVLEAFLPLLRDSPAGRIVNVTIARPSSRTDRHRGDSARRSSVGNLHRRRRTGRLARRR